MTMKLYGSLTSPYVRKARVLILEKRIPVQMVVEDPWPAGSPIPARNPLGKVPVLEIGPGNYLFESVQVVHYLDRAGDPPYEVQDPAAYWESQRWQALGNGILDAVVTRVLETRRPPEKQWPDKMAREASRVHRAVEFAERALGGEFLVGDRISLADLVMGVAMQYVDFRLPHDWRSRAPRLAKWHAGIAARESFRDTLPPGFSPPV